VAYPGIFLVELGKITKNIGVVGVLTEIRTDHSPERSLYTCTSLI
jgi:hypothetical protein